MTDPAATPTTVLMTITSAADLPGVISSLRTMTMTTQSQLGETAGIFTHQNHPPHPPHRRRNHPQR